MELRDHFHLYKASSLMASDKLRKSPLDEAYDLWV